MELQHEAVQQAGAAKAVEVNTLPGTKKYLNIYL